MADKIGTLIIPSKATTTQANEWLEGREILVPLLSSKRRLPFGFIIVIGKSQSQVHFANPVAAFDMLHDSEYSSQLLLCPW